MNPRLRFRALALPLAFAALVAACDSSSSDDAGADVPEAERFGGTAVIGIAADVPDLNPLTATDATSSELRQFVLFLPLVQYDEKFEPMPAFARSWDVNADTTLLTFHLRNDVFWHDGVKTTAYDVAFAYDMAKDPETGFPNTGYFTNYGTGTVVDSFTFQVEMKPHAMFMDPWRTFPAVPKHILGNVPAAEMRQQPFNSRQPVGNGPFKFASRVDAQSLTFEANADFPEELGGRPYLDRIVFRVIPDATTLLTELLTGGVDFHTAPIPEQAERILADTANLSLIHYPDRAFVLIGWNQRRPPFDDVRVRRALTMAIDRQKVVDAVIYGYGSLSNGTVPPFFSQFDAKAGAGEKFDREGALALFKEAGWTLGGDGVLQNAAGKPFTFTLNTNRENQARVDIATIIQAQLKEIGVNIEVQVLEWGTLLDRVNNPQRREFDAVLIGWKTDFRIDDTDLFHCDKRNQPYQWIGHCDERLDVLLDTLPKIANRGAAQPLWNEYQKLIVEQQPYTFIYYTERLQGVRKRLQGVSSDPRGDWVGVARWWILPTQRTP